MRGLKAAINAIKLKDRVSRGELDFKYALNAIKLKDRGKERLNTTLRLP
jgi:hypothetical protein